MTKSIVILSNHHAYTYNFRKEIIDRFLKLEYKIYLVLPYGERVEQLKEMGCEFIDLPLDRRGMNPLTDLKLLVSYFKMLGRIRPDAVLSYTVKPNIYGGIASRLKGIPFFPNVTGLGSAVEKSGIIQKLLVSMYRFSSKNTRCIFFQNQENKLFFDNQSIPINRYRIIPGSGVNVQHFNALPYPSDNIVQFVFISRIMKEKGIEQYVEAATYIRKKYKNTRFHVLGFCEEDYEKKLEELQSKDIIYYHGMQSDVRRFLKDAHCTIHPTYYPEGMSNVLLESAASARPIITTDRAGCREVVDDNVNGYIIKQENTKDLINKIERFLKLSYEEKKNMGLNGRRKMEEEFNREIVVEAYINEIKRLES
ncbi:galacturonosyltransferase [Terribacillus saccharophilus]|uniref:Galacturonosyltransferase n=1 Tax=Terribacillus saccharophilus TaxID=361277 RepID=A0AAX2EFF4_9BACI|nr:galacturonosyltransferase [Terribacillus saccharophilus]